MTCLSIIPMSFFQEQFKDTYAYITGIIPMLWTPNVSPGHNSRRVELGRLYPISSMHMYVIVHADPRVAQLVGYLQV